MTLPLTRLTYVDQSYPVGNTLVDFHRLIPPSADDRKEILTDVPAPGTGTREKMEALLGAPEPTRAALEPVETG